jgi:hypothetical protein
VFLVHHHQSRPGQRREDRRPGADHDAGVAPAGALPGVQALGVREAGVQHRDLDAGEARAEAADELWRQADLRHQHQPLAAAFQRPCDGVQIHLGLAAAGHALQEEDAPRRRGDRRYRRALRVVERRAAVLRGGAGQGREVRALTPHPVPFLQGPHGGAPAGGDRREFLPAEAPRGGEQGPQHG